ncbi:MAG TPA: GerW family sporulation protein [Thermoclostridium caenicola]|uniref:GerW family sporulation protein n=1 Tax=Thermoclostridium caenicola TaxID=659425 RepID=UPI002C170D62|nr:GerW family sporulation protein [Thermoclostridium caenicola]HOK44244.1 GerW family sporulation protein [Thermoclostridium caenicola]HOL85663.1 GerW family sporulation protein [Thermoclostridium caenicola]HOP71721.1 GerW family sporulation protein [Thermoclostridium caenicola]HPO77142.1 GerW family sporulation protein [Thermoclostridium caenicola]HPU21465.1 GerW family sporulation protein [Thermoclostridium caenicola]
MEPHPIQDLMKTAMESIREMVDVNTIVGDAVQTVDGTVIIPVSKVTFGFAAGGGDCSKGDNKNQESKFPFAGGSGAGVSINPVAFLVVGRNDTIRMIPASFNNPLDRLLEIVPNAIDQIKKTLEKKACAKKETEKKDEAGEEGKKCDKQQDD